MMDRQTSGQEPLVSTMLVASACRSEPATARLLRPVAVHRLDFRAAESATKTARARVKEEQLKLCPTLELGVSFEREEQPPVEGRNIVADGVGSSIAEGQARVEIDCPADRCLRRKAGRNLEVCW